MLHFSFEQETKITTSSILEVLDNLDYVMALEVELQLGNVENLSVLPSSNNTIQICPIPLGKFRGLVNPPPVVLRMLMFLHASRILGIDLASHFLSRIFDKIKAY